MSHYRITRSRLVEAPASRVRAHLDDLHAWQAWSPWEQLDPAMEREYSGPQQGVGARYAWRGNRKAGQGSQQVTAADDALVEVQTTFVKPFPGRNRSRFELVERPQGTQVRWTIEGALNPLLSLTARLFPMERMMGPDLEKGLAELKRVVEAD